MKQRFRLKEHVNELIFVVYLSLVWFVYLFVHEVHSGPDARKQLMVVLCVSALLTGILVLVVPGLFRVLRQWRLLHTPDEVKMCTRLFWFLLGGVMSYAVLQIWFSICSPGAFSKDSLDQLQEVVTGQYSDWHPAWHTLLFFTLPMKLTGSRASIVLFQMIWFALAMGLLTSLAYELGGVRAALLSWGVIMLNPYTGFIMMHPWKDVAFGIASMVAVILAVRLYCLHEASRFSLVLLGISLANATIFRHNGILLSGVLLLAVFFALSKKQWALVFISFALLFAAVKGPVYSFLKVEKPDQRVVETVGLPMNVIGNVVTQNPEAMDEELQEFVYAIAPQEVWDAAYKTGNYNSFKWYHADNSVVERAGAKRVLQMMFKCFRLAPLESAQGLFALTDLVYAVEGEAEDGLWIMGPDEGRALIRIYESFFVSTIFRYLRYIGLTLAALLALILARCRLNSRQDWKKILLCLSVFCYDFGTMLLLTGPDYRVFFVSFLVFPPLVLLMLYQKEPSANEWIGDHK